jgi:hypothetical protein
MDQASEESDLRADVAALSLNIERIENAIKEQTALLERLIPKEPSWKELSEAYNLDLIESEE